MSLLDYVVSIDELCECGHLRSEHATVTIETNVGAYEREGSMSPFQLKVGSGSED